MNKIQSKSENYVYLENKLYDRIRNSSSAAAAACN